MIKCSYPDSGTAECREKDMIIYSGTKADFERDVLQDTLADKLAREVEEKLHRRTGESEYNSWQNSSQYMFKVLGDTRIPEDAGVALEYNIPQTAKRIDYLISGYDEKHRENLVIVELKQWSKLDAIPGRETTVLTYLGGGLVPTVHPSYQAQSYADFIMDYNVSVQEDGILLHPCAYLHNYRRQAADPLDAPQYADCLKQAPAFTKGEVPDLQKFIRHYIRQGDDKRILYRIEGGRIRPSKSLQDEIAAMLRGKKEFTLIDDQMVVYETILEQAKKCHHDGKKRTIIVEGGPGTGKTVVAVNLLAALTQKDQYAVYTSRNAAPRNVYLEKLTEGGFRRTSVGNMFKGSGSFVDVPGGVIDTVLADEAHRLTEKSGMFRNKGKNQIREIIHAAKCSVFFLDETQRVTIYDIGSCAEIEKQAAAEGSKVTHLTLASQFRCNGSDGYLSWLDDVLEIRETANFSLDGIDYDFRVIDDPNTLRDLIIQRNSENGRNRSRIIAGYCWDWPKKEQSNPNYHDIRIGDFEMSWNLADSATYAIDPDSVNQAGCIHTTQGLEFDYVGIIIGDDMRFENGRIVTDFTRRARTDQSMRGIKKRYQQDPEGTLKLADEIIKNTYKTIMSRGMKGCYVYCTDRALSDYLKRRAQRSK